jgi:hypothetical protein
MSPRDMLRRLTAFVVGASVLLVVIAFALGGWWMGLGAAVGGALAVANFLAMRWVAHRLMIANDQGKMVWGTFLGLKMVALLAITWAILSTGMVDPTGFTIGLSGLVLGALAGALYTATSARPADDSATEEQS